ncbi:MAG: NUDIX hydrolase [Pseudomonadota bacterium]
MPNTPEPADISTMDELDIARAMAAGELPSPQRVVNMSLFAIRITGTGTAYRSAIDEFVYRPPEHYLTQDFLDRCNGLSVIYEHPEKRTLNSKEFGDRVVGSVMLPYIKAEEEEVWGIAKIYDDEAIEEMSDPTKKMSTSPTVVFRNLEDNSTIELDNGKAILIEGKPSLLDHVAICPVGVWDKGGEPAGVLNNSLGVADMTPEEYKAKADAFDEKAKADADEKEAMKKTIADMQAKMDSMAPAAPMPTAADKAKADAEKEEKEKADAECAAKEKADAEEKEAKEKADAEEEKKARADAAALSGRVASLEAGLNLSDADRTKIADAQMRANSLAMAFGDSASAPLVGESALMYRRRLLGKFKDHSETWKGVPMEAISDALIDVAEKQVYADAAIAARNPRTAAPGALREIKRTSPGGHQISEFVGSFSDFSAMFKPPVRRFVSQINNGTGR